MRSVCALNVVATSLRVFRRPGDVSAKFSEGLAAFSEGLTAFSEGLAKFSEGLAAFSEGQAAFSEGQAAFSDGLATFRRGIPTAWRVRLLLTARLPTVLPAGAQVVYGARHAGPSPALEL